MDKVNSTDKWIIKITYLLGALLLIVGIIVAIVLIDWDNGKTPIRVSVEGGNGAYTIEYNTDADTYTLTAQPDKGYKVEGWYGADRQLLSSDKQIELSQEEHQEVIVKYKIITVTVTYNFQNGSSNVQERYTYNKFYTTLTGNNGGLPVRIWSEKPNETYRALGPNQGIVSTYVEDITLYALY